MKTPIRSILFHVMSVRDSSGNTYSSARIWINGNLVFKAPYSYGYKDYDFLMNFLEGHKLTNLTFSQLKGSIDLYEVHTSARTVGDVREFGSLNAGFPDVSYLDQLETVDES